MARYKLLAGTYTGFDTSKPADKKTGRHPVKTHHAGSMVDSDEDLVERYGTNKFQLVGEGPKKHISKTPGDVAPGMNPTSFPAGQVSTGFQQTTGGGTEDDELVKEGGFSDPDSGSRSGPADDETRERLEAMESKANQAKMLSAQEQELKDKSNKLKQAKAAHEQQSKDDKKANAKGNKDESAATHAQLKGMTKAELQKLCDDSEVEYDDKATKEDLIKLLEE